MSFFFVSECNFSGFKWKCSLNTNSQVGLVGTGTFQAKIYIAPKKNRDTKNRWLGWLIMKIMKPRPYLKPWNWWLPLYTSHHLWGLVIQIAVAQIPNDLSLSALVCVWLNSVFYAHEIPNFRISLVLGSPLFVVGSWFLGQSGENFGFFMFFLQFTPFLYILRWGFNTRPTSSKQLPSGSCSTCAEGVSLGQGLDTPWLQEKMVLKIG